jgi:uncharacterized protein YciI
MLFVVAGYFRPDTAARREALEESFNEHLMQRVARVRFGGPLYDEGGNRSGVLLIVEAADFATAKAFLLASPFQEAGLYERIEASEVRPELGGLR